MCVCVCFTYVYKNHIPLGDVFEKIVASILEITSANEVLLVELEDLKKRLDSEDELQEKCDAANQQRESLKREYKSLQEKIEEKITTEKMHADIKQQIDAVNQQNDELEKELKQLRVRHRHGNYLDKTYNVAKVEAEAISLENEALRQEIREINEKLQNKSKGFT